MRFNMKYSVAILSLVAFPAIANVEITGSVEAKCVIQTTKAGAYGNPIASKLSTTPADVCAFFGACGEPVWRAGQAR